MKKMLALLGVMMFSASAFALNGEAPAGKDCQGQRAAFEQYAAQQASNYFIAQNILINLADPMAQLSDEEALPQAACYATYQVNGQRLVAFVRAMKDEFRAKEAGQLAAFADRVERLDIQAGLNNVAASGNVSHIMEYVVIHFADPMAKMSDAQAVPLAKAYKACVVNGQPMLEFVRVHASEFYGPVQDELDAFVERAEKLAK